MQHRLLITAVLITCAGCGHTPQQSPGFRVFLASAPGQEHFGYVCEQDMPVVTVLGNHRFQVSGRMGDAFGADRPESMDELLRQLRKHLSFLPERALYVRAEPSALYSDVIELLDGVYREVVVGTSNPNGLTGNPGVVSLITPRVEALAEGGDCLIPFASTPDPRR